MTLAPGLRRRGQLSQDGWETVVDVCGQDKRNAGIRIVEFADEERFLAAGDVERLVVPLSGSCTVKHNGRYGTVETTLQGRASVFTGPTDTLFIPAGTEASLLGRGRIAVAEARTTEARPWAYLAAGSAPPMIRGAGFSRRQVTDLAMAETTEPARLLVCEVVTRSGHWSSYPPHKHDEHIPGQESRLEEIYYFEASVTLGGPSAPDDDPFGLFHAYSGASDDVALGAIVRSGDVALVPSGYHGPAAAPPGYDLYYLNVMAGPDPERVWLSRDDPAHAWIRHAWTKEESEGE